MAEFKAQYETAEQEYRQHKERINGAAEEADTKKVACEILQRPTCRVGRDMEHVTKTTAVLFCPATGGAEQDRPGGVEVQASQEALRRQAQRPPRQHKDPGDEPGVQRAGASGWACSNVLLFFKTGFRRQLKVHLIFLPCGGSGFHSQGRRTLSRTSGGGAHTKELGQRDGASEDQNHYSGRAAGRP